VRDAVARLLAELATAVATDAGRSVDVVELTVREFAHENGISERTVRRRIESGELRSRMERGRWLIAQAVSSTSSNGRR
jgi:hypothetical protein